MQPRHHQHARDLIRNLTAIGEAATRASVVVAESLRKLSDGYRKAMKGARK